MNSVIEWIDVDSDLPKVGEYVLVLEDDHLNPQDVFHGELFDRIYPDRPKAYKPQRVKFAQLRSIDEEEGRHRVGYWQQWSSPGGYSLGSVRNVTYWARFPIFPVELIVEPLEEAWTTECEHRFRKLSNLSFEVCRFCGLKA